MGVLRRCCIRPHSRGDAGYRAGMVSDDVTRRVALVTGSSRGIGAETARQLATQGVRVAVTYREKARRAEQVVQEIEDRGGARQPSALISLTATPSTS